MVSSGEGWYARDSKRVWDDAKRPTVRDVAQLHVQLRAYHRDANRRDVGYVPQVDCLLDKMPLTVHVTKGYGRSEWWGRTVNRTASTCLRGPSARPVDPGEAWNQTPQRAQAAPHMHRQLTAPGTF